MSAAMPCVAATTVFVRGTDSECVLVLDWGRSRTSSRWVINLFMSVVVSDFICASVFAAVNFLHASAMPVVEKFAL